MKNLFHAEISEPQIAQALAQPRPALLPPIGGGEWARIAANANVQRLIAPLKARALSEIGVPLPALTDELYADFHVTGRRLPFEKLYFERRRHLARNAVCALVGPESERTMWLAEFTANLADLMAEPSWSLPAHVEVTTGKDPMRIDLFCAETANLMGEVVTLFEPVLPPATVKEIKARVQTQVFENYLANHGSIFWTKITNNWNGVCHQGILGAALALADARTCASMLVLATGYMRNFLNGYGADGGCEEGPGYWGYGFGWFAVLNEQLETASRGALSYFEGDEHVHAIALYGGRVSLSGNQLVNFSDCASEGALNPRLFRYLGMRLDEPDLVTLGNSGYSGLISSSLTMEAERCDLFYLGRLLRDLPDPLPDPMALGALDSYFKDIQVLVTRGVDDGGCQWEFAAKGGHNGEHHNHNDCGSYILNIEGSPLITEIGSPEYVRAFFSPTRYEFLAARTLGHSLPIVNGCEQAGGREYEAKVIECAIAHDAIAFVLDLTAAYPADAHCSSLIRRFHLDRRAGKLTIEDRYELTMPSPIETAIVSHATATQAIDGVYIRGRDAEIRITCNDNTLVTGIEAHGYSDHNGKPKSISRIVLKPAEASLSGALGYSVTISPNSVVRGR